MEKTITISENNFTFMSVRSIVASAVSGLGTIGFIFGLVTEPCSPTTKVITALGALGVMTGTAVLSYSRGQFNPILEREPLLPVYSSSND